MGARRVTPNRLGDESPRVTNTTSTGDEKESSALEMEMKLNDFLLNLLTNPPRIGVGIKLEEEESLNEFESVFESVGDANRPKVDEVHFYSRGTQKSRWLRSDSDTSE